MSFSCPHFEPKEDACLRLKTDCVPGRPGCVITGATFAVSVEERLKLRAAEKEASARERLLRELKNLSEK